MFPPQKNNKEVEEALTPPLPIAHFRHAAAGLDSHGLTYSSQVTTHPHLKCNEELKNLGAPVMCYSKNNISY